jgi:hypothetical protein
MATLLPRMLSDQKTHLSGFTECVRGIGPSMRLADDPADPPEPEPTEVPEPVAPVEVPEPTVEDTPERGAINEPLGAGASAR